MELFLAGAALLGALGAVIGVVAGLYPAWRAAASTDRRAAIRVRRRSRGGSERPTGAYSGATTGGEPGRGGSYR